MQGKFGHLIVDECHRCPAKTFTEVVAAFECKFMLGLSATPYRRDKLSQVIYFFMGPRVHTVDKAELIDSGAVLVPEIIQIETDFYFDYQDEYQPLLTALVQDEGRNQLIAATVRQVTDRGVVLIVSDRVSHCEELKELLKDQNPALLTGQTPRTERARIVEEVQAGRIKILIATVQLIGEGFDCNGLTVQVLATPVMFQGRLTQIVGRILRPGKNKRPLVVDFQDSQVGLLKYRAGKRWL